MSNFSPEDSETVHRLYGQMCSVLPYSLFEQTLKIVTDFTKLPTGIHALHPDFDFVFDSEIDSWKMIDMIDACELVLDPEEKLGVAFSAVDYGNAMTLKDLVKIMEVKYKEIHHALG